MARAEKTAKSASSARGEPRNPQVAHNPGACRSLRSPGTRVDRAGRIGGVIRLLLRVLSNSGLRARESLSSSLDHRVRPRRSTNTSLPRHIDPNHLARLQRADVGTSTGAPSACARALGLSEDRNGIGHGCATAADGHRLPRSLQSENDVCCDQRRLRSSGTPMRPAEAQTVAR